MSTEANRAVFRGVRCQPTPPSNPPNPQKVPSTARTAEPDGRRASQRAGRCVSEWLGRICPRGNIVRSGRLSWGMSREDCVSVLYGRVQRCGPRSDRPVTPAAGQRLTIWTDSSERAWNRRHRWTRRPVPVEAKAVSRRRPGRPSRRAPSALRPPRCGRDRRPAAGDTPCGRIATGRAGWPASPFADRSRA